MSTPADESASLYRTVYGWTLLLLSCCALFAWLGAGSLVNGDDAVYAWATRQMVADGTWMDYRWYDSPLHQYYPPLHFFFTRLSVTVFGVSDFAMRLPAALAGLCTIGFTGSIAARLARSHAAGLFAGLALLSTLTFYSAARSVRMDSMFLAMAMAVYWAYLQSWTNSRWLWLVGGFAGLTYLSKSIMVVMVLAPLLIDLVWHRRDLLKTRVLWGSVLVFIAIALSWHLALWGMGAPPIPSYGNRVSSGIEGDYAFLAVVGQLLAEYSLVATLALAAGLGWLVFLSIKNNERGAQLMLMSIGICVAILVLSSTTMLHYFLPLFPALAIGLGWLLSLAVRDRPVFSPLVVVGLLGLFAQHNLASFVHPDYSPGVHTIAEKTRSLSPQEPILFFRDYSASFDYYVEMDTLLVTESASAFALYTAHGAMRDGPGIELMEEQEILRRLATPGTAAVTTLFSADMLASYYAALPPQMQERLIVEHAGAYTLYYLPR